MRGMVHKREPHPHFQFSTHFHQSHTLSSTLPAARLNSSLESTQLSLGRLFTSRLISLWRDACACSSVAPRAGGAAARAEGRGGEKSIGTNRIYRSTQNNNKIKHDSGGARARRESRFGHI